MHQVLRILVVAHNVERVDCMAGSFEVVVCCVIKGWRGRCYREEMVEMVAVERDVRAEQAL